jgi:hypothetical protein
MVRKHRGADFYAFRRVMLADSPTIKVFNRARFVALNFQ